MTTYKIREVKKEDLPDVLKLHENLWQEVYFSYDRFKEDLPDMQDFYPSGVFYVVESDVSGAIIGFGGLKILSKGEARMKSIRIDPKYRNLGIARELIKKREEFAQLKGIKKISLVISSLSYKALNLYKSLGYSIVKTKDVAPDKKIYYLERVL